LTGRVAWRLPIDGLQAGGRFFEVKKGEITSLAHRLAAAPGIPEPGGLAFLFRQKEIIQGWGGHGHR
jgi:hypothetical protein